MGIGLGIGRARGLGLLLCMMALLATACGANDSFAETTSDSGNAASEPAFDQSVDTADFATDDDVSAESDEFESAAGLADNADLGSGGVEAIGAQVIDIGRDIIYTADVEVSVVDVPAASLKATEVISSLGGLIFGQSSTGNPTPRNVLTFKVRPEDFQEALTRLGNIGELRRQNVTADDVTERVANLNGRISTAQASVDRLSELISTVDSKDLLALEAQILDRETNLELLRGQLKTVQDRVDLATITLTIVESSSRPAISVTSSTYLGHDQGTSCSGSRDFAVDKGEDVTFCFDIINVGDAPLTSIKLADPGIGITNIGQTRVSWGVLDQPLLPGESVTVSYDSKIDQTVAIATRVSAQPLDKNDEPAGSPVNSTDNFRITALDPEGVPGFGDGLSGSLAVLATLGQILILLAGVLLPFIWLIPVIWFGGRWLKGRRADSIERQRLENLRREQERQATMPPAPRASHGAAQGGAAQGGAAQGGAVAAGPGDSTGSSTTTQRE